MEAGPMDLLWKGQIVLSTLRTLITAAACLIVTLAFTVAPASGANASTAAAPDDLRVTDTGFDEISLAWTRVPGAEFYRVLVNGVWRSGVYDPAAEVTITQLQPGTTYTFEVQSRPAGGEFGAGATVRASTRADTQPPSPPSDLHLAKDGTGRSIGITWNTPTDNWGVEDRYRIFADQRLALIGGKPATWPWLTDPYHGGLSCGTTYTFTVQAWDKAGNLSAHSAPLRTTIPPC
jgi:hypothetical protein